jgi:Fur family ferric uptake transcriptional regulator
MEKCALQFREYLRRHGLKFTRERKAIVEAVHSSTGHFDVEDLIFQLRKRRSRISRGTVYRTIPLLVEARVLRAVAFTDRHAHYEDTCKTRHHEHLICSRCGKVIEFLSPFLEKELERVCREHQFQPTAHKMEVTGCCRECRVARERQKS